MSSQICAKCAGEFHAVIGAENIFGIEIEQPSLSAPTGSIKFPGEDAVELTFTGQAPIVISSLGSGRRSLVLGAAPTLPLAGAQGQASIVSTGTSSSWPCTVSAYSTTDQVTTALLAAAIERELPAGATSQLVFRYWAATLPVIDIPRKEGIVTMRYVPVAPIGSPEIVRKFTVKYVPQLFATGLTASDLRAYLSGGPSAPTSDAGLEPKIEEGLGELVRHLRVELSQRGLDETAIPAPSALRDAHRLYSAACLYQFIDQELASSLFSQARYAADDTLRNLWVDIDGTGTPTRLDTKNITGLRSRDFAFKVPRRIARPRPLPGWWL